MYDILSTKKHDGILAVRNSSFQVQIHNNVHVWVLCNSNDPKLFWRNWRPIVTGIMLIQLWHLTFQGMKKKYSVCVIDWEENSKIGLRQWQHLHHPETYITDVRCMTHMIPWEYFMKKMFFVERGGRVTPLGERMIWGETSWRGFTTQQDTVPPLWNKKSQLRNKLLIWKKK